MSNKYSSPLQLLIQNHSWMFTDFLGQTLKHGILWASLYSPSFEQSNKTQQNVVFNSLKDGDCCEDHELTAGSVTV